MTDTAATGDAPRTKFEFSRLLGLTLVGVLLAMFLFLAWKTSTFATPGNLSNLARQGAIFAILALGQTFVIITAGIDLSVGAVASFITVVVAMLIQSVAPDVTAWLVGAGLPESIANGVALWIMILASLLLGAGIGAFHAFGVVKMGLPPFIITLATFTALRGVGLLMTNGSTVNVTNDVFTGFSRGEFLGIPNLFMVVIVVAVPAFVYLHLSRWGRYLYAVGSNPEAARLSGVNVNAVTATAYILSSVCAAIVGVMLASRTGTGNATQAIGFELEAIAASVIGGTSLFGAIGSVWGPLLGAFILATIRNGANLMNVNSFWQFIITGVLIIAIVYADGLRRRRR
ncbi:ABC transporter permease [Alsobacter sp. SYSU M60028]|uniref:ABC transporter permease n=1 Tax=Alsobacter ponti TaxID=2962936 RepID=A0ABT1LAW4_9HYPH|nr:ABC transporter permease [Alsobacter ponti]MCP8937910.1 ABC transporter permease [Alsobacter ponti]